MNLPEGFRERYKNIIPDFDGYLSSLDKPPAHSFWINSNKIDPRDCISAIDFPIKNLPYSDDAFLFDLEGIGNSPLHHSGAIYCQEPSAMAVILSLPDIPDAPILDVCASPGGKSLQIARRTNDKCVLVSNEYSSQRIKPLLQNIERCGIKNSIVTNFDGASISEHLPRVFGTLIIDAPCSGEGMMRKSENEFDNWSIENIEISAERQKKILSSAKDLLLDGGYLIYSTCTFAPEENEMQIAEFLRNNPEFSLILPNQTIIDNSESGIPLPAYPDMDFSLCRRFYPHKSKGEGQFLAILKKSGEFIAPKLKCEAKISKEAERIAKEFLAENLNSMPDMLLSEEKDGIYLIPRFPKIKSGVFSGGVKLGIIQKGRLIPHHRFFSAFGYDFKRSIDLKNDIFLCEKYLSGEEIKFDCENGFCAVKYFGAAIGGGKASNGIIKNHYPKGLRNNPQ